ncbi:MAG: hypothetical protein IAG13_30825 [Deltaproteobacteria bacterium]|nr:hypothetical protein [Nannocystaceae bacterium]
MRWGLLIGAVAGACTSEPEPSECRQYRDDAGTPTAVDIVIRNDRAETLLLTQPCGDFAVHLESDRGWTSATSLCNTSCGQRFDIAECTACFTCLGVSYFSLAPGEQVVLRWSGNLFEHASPAPECFAADACGDSCDARRIPRDGTIDIRVEAITDAECVAAEPDPSVCTCTPGPIGCEVEGTATIAPTISLRESFDMAAAAASGTVSFVLE